MSETLTYIKMFGQLPWSLSRFLRHPLTLDQAGQIVRERMEHREENFLRLVERGVYGYPGSPYLPLLKRAGCTPGDLRALVKQKGVEGALCVLRDEGVYVSFEEFKGRKPIERQGLTLPVNSADFDNPFIGRDLASQTGGSTGAPSRVFYNLDHIASLAPHRMLSCAAHGVLDVPSAVWRGVYPDGSGVNTLLHTAHYRRMPIKWFSHISMRDSNNWPRYAVATYYVVLLMRLFGLPAPFPQFVPLEQAIVVARWIDKTCRSSERVLVNTQVSRALRICLAAQDAGLDIGGATFMVAGEPLTFAKVREIVRTGARYFPAYGMVEAGRVGMGCARPNGYNDVHLLKDAFALITFPFRVQGIGATVPAFTLTTLLPNAPKLMLNVQIDDYGMTEERVCGCELGNLGYTTHLYDIRSHNKLTGEGVTLVGSDLVRILEEVLPARFGGSSLDYQLEEEEDGRGVTRVSLVISPRIEIADEQAVIEAVLNELHTSSGSADATRIVWQQANSLQIKRAEPFWTARGKFMPLHVARDISGARQEN